MGVQGHALMRRTIQAGCSLSNPPAILACWFSAVPSRGGFGMQGSESFEAGRWIKINKSECEMGTWGKSTIANSHYLLC